MNSLKKVIVPSIFFGIFSLLSCKDNNPVTRDEPLNSGARTAHPDTLIASERQTAPASFSVANEKFLIRAESPDSLNGAIFLTFASERPLGCDYTYLTIQSQINNRSVFEIHVGDLITSSECNHKDRKAISEVVHYPGQKGENPFTIHIGGKSFEGTLVVTDDRYIFEWPDESQFKFYDKTIYL